MLSHCLPQLPAPSVTRHNKMFLQQPRSLKAGVHSVAIQCRTSNLIAVATDTAKNTKRQVRLDRAFDGIVRPRQKPAPSRTTCYHTAYHNCLHPLSQGTTRCSCSSLAA